MKTLTTLIVTITLSLVAIPQAFAATTTRVYSSGLLVLAFLGVCALIVVVQMIPAIITLSGIVKELLAGKGKEEEAKAEISN
jgi:ABC-type siderophore export system fused ATPase/permease subunit